MQFVRNLKKRGSTSVASVLRENEADVDEYLSKNPVTFDGKKLTNERGQVTSYEDVKVIERFIDNVKRKIQAEQDGFEGLLQKWRNSSNGSGA